MATPEMTVTLPITLRPEEGETGRWIADVGMGDDSGYFGWGLGDSRYEAVRDLLHSMAVEMGALHQDCASLGPESARDYAALRAWVGEGVGDGD